VSADPTALATLIVAVCALVLSIYNTYAQRRDRIPRVKVTASWAVSTGAPGAFQGIADSSIEMGKAVYRCEITNIGVAGVKIMKVTVVPQPSQTSPGRPLQLDLPQGEQPRKLDNGDSQAWLMSFDMVSVFQRGLPKNPVRVFAEDTVGNVYEAQEPAPWP
jgi:hypothetical protein